MPLPYSHQCLCVAFTCCAHTLLPHPCCRWPCFEGPELSPHYNDPNDLGVPYHGNAACLQIQNSNTWRRPAFAYRKPENPPPGNVQSISAVAAVQGIVVYADLTKQIVDQLNGAFGNDETVTRGVGVVEF